MHLSTSRQSTQRRTLGLCARTASVNDGAHLYLFFKCTPSVQKRYEKTHRSGGLGSLYIDSDMDTNTGSGMRDSSGGSPVQGADFLIDLPVGLYASYSAEHGSESGCYVEYDIKLWDPALKDFSRRIRRESSRSEFPLIAHGKEGVEIAFPLADLQKHKGDKFTFACWEDSSPREYISTTTIEIK